MKDEPKHSPDCELVTEGTAGDNLEWVGPNADYEGDEVYCTCGLAERRERLLAILEGQQDLFGE